MTFWASFAFGTRRCSRFNLTFSCHRSGITYWCWDYVDSEIWFIVVCVYVYNIYYYYTCIYIISITIITCMYLCAPVFVSVIHVYLYMYQYFRVYPFSTVRNLSPQRLLVYTISLFNITNISTMPEWQISTNCSCIAAIPQAGFLWSTGFIASSAPLNPAKFPNFIGHQIGCWYLCTRKGKAKHVFFLIYLFIYLWLCWVFVSVRGPSPAVASGGPSSSLCVGLSLSRPLPLQSTGSRHAGSAVVAHGPSCSAACGILPDQGPNPCPLHWQADPQPLHHQGSPKHIFKTQRSRKDHISGEMYSYSVCIFKRVDRICK